jgi:SAM-dependent methyltransferase
MRWLAKAFLQKTLSALPGGERANYTFQRRVTRSLPGPEERFRRRFTRAAEHLDAFAEHTPQQPLRSAVFYEFGAGWDLAIPLSFWALGVERQILVDVHPNVRTELVNVTIERLGRLGLVPERSVREPGGPIDSADDLEPRFGIRYLAPHDARATGLPGGSVDFVTNTNTLEHIPGADLVPLLAECRRLLHPKGALSSRIDLSDHFSQFDDSLSPYNFLRYSDRAWGLVNSRLLYQNRLRRPDYLAAFERAGFRVVAEKAWRPNLPLPDDLDARFRPYDSNDLRVLRLRIVAVPSPDALEEAEHIVG